MHDPAREARVMLRERVSGKAPVVEHIVTDVRETFLWRLDNYPWERNVWNVHPEYEIHLVRKCDGVALVGDHIERFEPGHLAIVGSYLPHDWVSSLAPGEVVAGRDIVLQFDPKRVRDAAAFLPELAGVGAFLDLALRGLAFEGETRREGARRLEAMGDKTGLERLAAFLELLASLSKGEYRVLSSAAFAARGDGADHSWIQPVVAYLVEHFAEDIHLPDIASRFGMNAWTFSRRFQKSSGKSFTDYLTSLRLSQVCKLLADTDLPVTDICFEVGYANVSNFNRAFLKAHRMSPSLYRRLARNRVTQRRITNGAAADSPVL
jgi:AraC-like DNA-binding protein